jgi:tetratricopeptide (TPR) repeat protein
MEQTRQRTRLDWPGLLSAVSLAIGTVAIYGRTLDVPLLLDDNGSIENNLSIRQLWPLGPIFSPPVGAGVAGRPLLNLSYAMNYAAGGTAVAGYHLVNILIHVLAGLTLFALARRTLRSPILIKRFGPASTGLALAIGAIWAWHPVLTESVTYLSQRAESLMGLFYLLTLYCFVRGADGDPKKSSRIWFTLSVLACLAGVGTKEIIVTAPLVVFLFDRTFVSGGFSNAWRRHWPVHMALAATWLPLGLLMAGLQARGAGFGQGGVAWWAYGLVECRVVVKYILLLFRPNPLVFDYGMYAGTSLSAVWPYAVAIGSLLTLTGIALWRSPALGFAACWFFLILAPTSSIVSISESPMAENRLYLPSAGVAALAVLGLYFLAGRRSLPAFAVVACALAFASARRNEVYLNEQALWRDTADKVPTNARALNNLACVVLDSERRVQDAISLFEEALRLRPDFAEVHNNLARALENVPGRLDEAISHCKEALREVPDYAEAHCTLGLLWLDVPGHVEDAIAEFKTALRLKPDYAEAHYSLGGVWMNQPGRLNPAVAEFEAALQLKPDYAEAHANLGNAWLRMPDRLNDAIGQFEEALRLRPGSAELHSNLAFALNAAGRTKEAIAQYEAALRLKPEVAELHSNLAFALNAAGRTKEAIDQYETALRLKPDLVQAHFALAVVLLGTDTGSVEAVEHLETVLRIQPENEAARQLLARIRDHKQ